MIPEMKTPEGSAEPTGAEGIAFSSESAKFTPTTEAAQCGKAAAIHAYCLGWLSLESCAELFRANPSWRNA